MCFDLVPGFSQGVRRSVGGLATILGPLWAGGLTENMYIMLGVIMALLLLLTVTAQSPETVLWLAGCSLHTCFHSALPPILFIFMYLYFSLIYSPVAPSCIR